MAASDHLHARQFRYYTGTAKLDDLVPTQKPELTSQANVDYLRNEISQNGIQQPIEVNYEGGQMGIGDGHHRYQAAREAGLTEAPVSVRTAEGKPSQVTNAKRISRNKFYGFPESYRYGD